MANSNNFAVGEQCSNPAILFDITVWFILRAAMIPRLLLVFVCGLLGTTAVVAQRLPKNTGKEPDKPTSAPREHRRRPRPIIPATSRTPTSIESNKFLDLGDTFRQQKKWNAAEAAYKEAVNVWSGNADALLELGFLYLDRNRLDDAQQTQNKLRSVNASYASDLLAEINRYKNALAH
jgi:tetratricopeptide (TPR) repeat protein